jgi:DNA-binding transcriptional ArsR family regulator
MSIFNGLITSKMRVRILMRLFLNPDQQSYIRELAEEMNASPSQVSDELKSLDIAGLLHSEKRGRQVFYSANQMHPLYPELHSMVRKALGMDRIFESVLERLGNLEQAILIDDYAIGKDSGLIDMVLIGDINLTNLDDLVRKTEKYIHRKIRTLVFTREEFEQNRQLLSNRRQLVLWESGK